jgi:hypothetical protein
MNTVQTMGIEFIYADPYAKAHYNSYNTFTRV